MSRIIRVGMSKTKRFLITKEDVAKFGDLIHDHNPVHSDPAAAKAAGFPNIICYGAFAGSLFSGVLATDIPGPNTIYMSQTLRYNAPIFVGEEIDVHVEVTQFRKSKGIIGMKTIITKEDKETKKTIVCVEGAAVGMNKQVQFEGESPEWRKE